LAEGITEGLGYVPINKKIEAPIFSRFRHLRDAVLTVDRFISNESRDVGFWHLAYNPVSPIFVRFRTIADNGGF
jgi:hypothetical protein